MNEAVLKWVGLVTMFLDHAALCLLWQLHGSSGYGLALESPAPGVLYTVLRAVGRTAFPIFAFGIAEGYQHTRSRGRYWFRLLLLAVVSQLPFWLVTRRDLNAHRNLHLLYGQIFSYKITGTSPLWLNTVFTLAAGLLAIVVVDRLTRPVPGNWRGGHRPAAILRVAAAAAFTAGLCWAADEWLHVDYGWEGVLLVLLFWLTREHRLAGTLGGWILLCVSSPSELYSIGGFLLIQCYNGKRGRQCRSLFYWFYPVHLLVLFAIRFLIAGY